MFRLSAFADEISPDPQEQVDLLHRCGVHHIELRSIHKTNVLDLTDLQVSELKSLLDQRGFRLSAIGSPIGKTRIDQPFDAVLKRLDRAIELCKTFDTPNIRGFDPWQGWQKTKSWTAHFHIKDWVSGEKHGRLAGEGQGRLPEVLAEAVQAGYDGFATLEPHLLGGGPTGGATGPELFPKAVAAFKAILDQVGAEYDSMPRS